MPALTWLKGLLAAVISAVASSILSSGFASASGSPLNWAQIGSIAGSSALVGACLYLKQSPIPDEPPLEIPFRKFSDMPRPTLDVSKLDHPIMNDSNLTHQSDSPPAAISTPKTDKIDS